MLFHTETWKTFAKRYEGASWNKVYTGAAWTKRLQMAWGVGLCLVFVGVPLGLQVVEPWAREKKAQEQRALQQSYTGVHSREPEALHDAVLDAVKLRRLRKAERRVLAAESDLGELTAAAAAADGGGGGGGGGGAGGGDAPPTGAVARSGVAAAALAVRIGSGAAPPTMLAVPMPVSMMLEPAEGVGGDDQIL
jgi:hypothetical protein